MPLLRRLGDFLARHARGLTLANLAAQGGIIVTGGTVRVTGSGLGCSTAPACEPGQFFPSLSNLEVHTAIEYGNRMLTGVLLVVAVLLAVAVWRSRPGLRWLGLVPALGVLAQAVLGAVTVHVELHPLVVGPHLLLSVALVWFSAWLALRYRDAPGLARAGTPARGASLAWARRALVAAFVAVVLLGVLTTGAGPHSGDAEQTERLNVPLEAAARAHAAAVWAFCAALVWLAWALWRRHGAADRVAGADREARRAVVALAVVTLLQGAIGYTQYLTGLPEALVAAHLLGIAVLTAAAAAAVTLTRPAARGRA